MAFSFAPSSFTLWRVSLMASRFIQLQGVGQVSRAFTLSDKAVLHHAHDEQEAGGKEEVQEVTLVGRDEVWKRATGRAVRRETSTRGATVDGIHLSVQGQTLMKALIESLLGDQLNPGSGTYHQCERTPKSESGASIDEHSRQDAETHHRSVR